MRTSAIKQSQRDASSNCMTMSAPIIVSPRFTWDCSNLWGCDCPTLTTCRYRHKLFTRLLHNMWLKGCRLSLNGNAHELESGRLEGHATWLSNSNSKMVRNMYPSRQVVHKLRTPHNVKVANIDRLVLVLHVVCLHFAYLNISFIHDFHTNHVVQATMVGGALFILPLLYYNPAQTTPTQHRGVKTTRVRGWPTCYISESLSTFASYLATSFSDICSKTKYRQL